VKPVIAITLRDFNGIGPEIALKAICAQETGSLCRPLLVGPWPVFRYYADRFRLSLPPIHIAEPETPARLSIAPGQVSAESGRIAASAIRKAVQLVGGGFADALVTAPVSKLALHKGGIRFPGQTEYLQHLTGSRQVAMVLVAGAFRVGLATIHVPLKMVSRLLTRKVLTSKIVTIHHGLVSDWGISRPRIAVLGLNPHAGEDGHIGDEERRVLRPVIRSLRSRRIAIDGPFSADSFFARRLHRGFDAVIAMYHDQGLIPLKLSAGGRGVNVSVGLPLVRTSPDHGTAFDIAGKGVADPSSLIEAIRVAVALSKQRRKHRSHD